MRVAHTLGALITFVILQFLIYLVATIDFRAVATGRIGWVVATNAALPMLTFAMTKTTAETHQGLLGAVAVAVGGVAAAVVGMWLTRHWKET